MTIRRTQKTTDEIFYFLVTNAKYYKIVRTKEDIDKLVKEYPEDDISLPCYLDYIPEFHVELEAFQEFTGELYSYTKHIKPLVDAGLIYCNDSTLDGFYSTKKYKQLFDPTTGTCKDYDTGVSYITFWLGKDDPNK